MRRACWFLLSAALLVTVLQLLPLPAAVMGALEDRVPIGVDNAAGRAIGSWHSITVSPHATWSGFVSVLVPLAIFLAVAQIGEHSRIRLAQLLIALGAISLVVGLLQVAQGPESQLRFFEVTNPSEAVGFFANRNHFAALMYVTLVLAATWLISIKPDFTRRQLLATHYLVLLAAAFGLVVAIVAALAVARSRAGILLTMIAMVGLVLLIRFSSRKPQGGSDEGGGVLRLIAVTLGFALLFAAQFGLHRVMTRLGVDPLEDLRIPLTLTTLEEALRSFPFGTGIGSFVPVFAVVERPTELLATYANRAHNDFAEWLLELGIVAPLLFGIALVWFISASVRVWRDRGHARQHLILQRAATLIVLLLLAHSLVDYPLRTTALMSVFAFASALLLPARHDPAHNGSGRQHRSDAGSEIGREARVPEAPRPLRPRERWSGVEAWPEAWREPPASPGEKQQ